MQIYQKVTKYIKKLLWNDNKIVNIKSSTKEHADKQQMTFLGNEGDWWNKHQLIQKDRNQ